MQEITLQLWKSYPGFKGKSKFSTWMYRIALNNLSMRLTILKKTFSTKWKPNLKEIKKYVILSGLV